MLLSNIVTSVNKGNIQHTIFILELDIRTPLCGGDNISFLGQKKNKIGMVVGEFLFLVTKSLKSWRHSLLSSRENYLQNFSFSFRNWKIYLDFSSSSRSWRNDCRFLDFFTKILVLFSNQKTDLDISLFSSRNLKFGFHVSFSLLDFTFWHLVNAWVPSLITAHYSILHSWTCYW